MLVIMVVLGKPNIFWGGTWCKKFENHCSIHYSPLLCLSFETGSKKYPFDACLVLKLWLTLLYKSWQYSTLGTLDTEIFLIKQSRESIALSFTSSQPRILCILIILTLLLQFKVSRAALFWTNCNFSNSLLDALGHTTGHSLQTNLFVV